MGDTNQDVVNGLEMAGDESRVCAFAAADGSQPVEAISHYGSGNLWIGSGWLDPAAARSLGHTLLSWATRTEEKDKA